MMDFSNHNHFSIIKEKDTVSLGFISMDEKIIYLNQYPISAKIKEVISDFYQKNDEDTLKPYFNINNNFSKFNLSFYVKKDEDFQKIEINQQNNVIGSLNIDELADTVNFLGLKYNASSSTYPLTNFDYLKIYVKYEVKLKDLNNNFEEYIINTTYLIGIPQLNQKKYYLYNKYLNQRKEMSFKKINSFSLLDTYCNAQNYLYIYEGVSENDKNKFSKFYNINLHKNEITLISEEFPKRFMHSMIYIPSCYIFIIGGKDTNEVLYYEIKDKNTSYNIYPHTLPMELLEPSLISINNKYIYALENSTIYLKILRINLLKLSPFEELEIKNNKNLKIEQKFFGVVKNKNSIIFLGGQMLNMNGKNNNQELNYCFEYDYELNEINISKRIFKPANFIEKTFIPFGNELYAQFLEYNKDNNKDLKMVQFDGKEHNNEKDEKK